MTPQDIPVDRVRIFNRKGFPLAEFRARVERSWALVDEGRAQFTYPTRITEIVNKEVLQYGNWLYVENSALPAWVGVIDTPRTWSSRTVTVSAYTPEKVFGWRYGVLESIRRDSAGAIFNYLLQLVNLAESTIISAGVIDTTGQLMQETVNPTPLSEDLRRIQERSGEEYQFRPFVDERGRLVVYADWTKRIGSETGALLHEGKGGGNIENSGSILVEDGQITNDLAGYNDAETWQSKVIQKSVDAQSVFDYGLRQASQEFSGVYSTVAMDNNIRWELKKRKNPKKNFALSVLNVGETFKYIGVGNVLSLQLQNIGFTGGGVGSTANVRISAMHYDPAMKNKIKITVGVV